MIGIDTETALITPDRPIPPMTCVSWADGIYSGVEHHSTAEAGIRRTFRHEPEIVAHNAAFDATVIMAEYPSLIPDVLLAYSEGRVRCTMIEHRLGLIERGEYFPTGQFASLDELCPTVNKADPWRTHYGELRDVPIEYWPADAVSYARDDAVAVTTIPRGAYPDAPFRVRAALALHLVGAWGICTDPVAVGRLRTGLTAVADWCAERLRREGLMRPDGTRDAKAAASRVEEAFRRLGKPTPLTEPKRSKRGMRGGGRTRTDAPTLIASGDEALGTLALYQKCQTDASLTKGDCTAYEAGGRYVVHADFIPLVRTGRTACDGPNMQNRDRRMSDVLVLAMRERGVDPTGIGHRECFVPAPDHVYLQVDFPQLELFCLSELCYRYFGRSELGERLRQRLDEHSYLGAVLTGTTYDTFRAAYLAGDSFVENTRGSCKPWNFGLAGGAGDKRLVDYAWSQYGVRADLPMARRMRQAWERANPTIARNYMARQRKVAEMGTVELISGFRRGGVGYTDACNMPFQGLGALCALEALWNLVSACLLSGVLQGSRVVNFIHDEFFIETRHEGIAEKKAAVAQLVADGANKWLSYVPYRVEDFKVEALDRWRSK